MSAYIKRMEKWNIWEKGLTRDELTRDRREEKSNDLKVI